MLAKIFLCTISNLEILVRVFNLKVMSKFSCVVALIEFHLFSLCAVLILSKIH